MAEEQPRHIGVGPSDIVIYYDPQFPPDPGSGTADIPAINQVAVVIDERGAFNLYKTPFGERVRSIPLQAISNLPNIQIRRSLHAERFGSAIANYFLKHARQPALFKAGMAALYHGNMQPFIEGSLFPDRPKYSSDEDYERAWQRFFAALQPMDFILTRDLNSSVSSFIAWSTHGPFSHIACYAGNGEVAEYILTGYRRGPLETYKSRKYWVAAYRPITRMQNSPSLEEADVFARNMDRFKPGYNYRAAIFFGWKSFLGNHNHLSVPNSVLYSGTVVLVDQV